MLRPCAGAAARTGCMGSRSGRQGRDAVAGNGVIGRDRFVRLAGGADGPVLVCFPWAGGSASTHVPFPEGASAAAEVLIVQCPGRQEWPTRPAVLARPAGAPDLRRIISAGETTECPGRRRDNTSAAVPDRRRWKTAGRSGASSFAADGAAVRGGDLRGTGGSPRLDPPNRHQVNCELDRGTLSWSVAPHQSNVSPSALLSTQYLRKAWAFASTLASPLRRAASSYQSNAATACVRRSK